MERLNNVTNRILKERFGKETLIALGTSVDNIPYVRSVNAFYDDGAFYAITHSNSRKMRQIEENPVVAISGDQFAAHGHAENLGYYKKKENEAVAAELNEAFHNWIESEQLEFDDENVCVLRITLTEGILFSQGIRYEIEF